MDSFFGIPTSFIASQLVLGLINGCFYALLSLGLALIFGMLNVVNFAHGTQYMMGAFGAYMMLERFGGSYWMALVIVPLAVGMTGIAVERLLLRPLYSRDHLSGMLLTFGLAMVIQGIYRKLYGASGLPYQNPMPGGVDLGFMFLPTYRIWVVVVSVFLCFGTWLVVERTKLGSVLRAATHRPDLAEAFGVNVPRMLMLTYGAGAALAAFAGVMAAPIYQVNPLMGSSILITVFAVVVIGGMGSLLGASVAGLSLGVIEGATKIVYPEGSSLVIFVLMGIVLLARPAGLFGTQQ